MTTLCSITLTVYRLDNGVRWVAIETFAGANSVRSHFEKVVLDASCGQPIDAKQIEDEMIWSSDESSQSSSDSESEDSENQNGVEEVLSQVAGRFLDDNGQTGDHGNSSSDEDCSLARRPANAALQKLLHTLRHGESDTEDVHNQNDAEEVHFRSTSRERPSEFHRCHNWSCIWSAPSLIRKEVWS